MGRRRTELVDLALAGVAGYVGTKAMEPVGMKLYEWTPQADRDREDAVRPGPPFRIAAEKITGALGVAMTDKGLDRLGLLFHYGLALSWAPLYPGLRRRLGWSPVVAAAVTGTAMSVVADELMTPAFGFSAPNLEYPLTTHLRGFAAHLVFGAAVAATVEAGWAVLGQAPGRRR
jgi:hypothetical protein